MHYKAFKLEPDDPGNYNEYVTYKYKYNLFLHTSFT